MSPIADRFHFVNKSAESASLSHSDAAEEKFYIQSYVQSKYRKKLHRPKQPTEQPLADTPTQQDTVSQPAKDIVVFRAFNLRKRRQTRQTRQTRKLHDEAPSSPDNGSLTRLPQALPAENGMDPFHCTPVTIDSCTHRLLQYLFSGFVETTFQAESLGLQPQSSLSTHKFRHRHSLVQKIRRCVDDEMVMYATLAYCASSIRFANSEIVEERPPEFYMVKAIEVIRSHLQQPNPVNVWLIVSIYALSISEMLANHREASAAHLKIIRHFIIQFGGMRRLEPYMMETLILLDKYLALCYLATARVQKIQIKQNPMLDEMASAFFKLDEQALGSDMQTIIADLVACLRIAHAIYGSHQVDPNDERWLFLRHQALVYRLLTTTTQTTLQECVRITLIVWILKTAKSLHCSQALLPLLNNTLLKLEPDSLCENTELLFWVVCMGAMGAEDPALLQWYVLETARLSSKLGLEAEEEQYKMVLQRYLFLKSDQGPEMTNLVRAVSDLQKGPSEIHVSDV